MSLRERTPWSLLGLLTVAGGFLRFWRLGAKSFSGNEDYLAISVRSLLEHGIPVFPSGVLYPRALPLTYLTAAFASLFGQSEAVLRTPSAIFSTLCIPLAWFLARRTCDVRTAWIAGALVAVSYWEIQTSHTARMYAMLGFSLLVVLLAIYESEILDRTMLRVVALAAILLSCSLHQIAGVAGPMLVVFGVFLFLRRGRLGLVPAALVVILIGVSANFLAESHFYGQWDAKVEAATGINEQPEVEAAPDFDRLEHLAAPLYARVRVAAPNAVRVFGWLCGVAALMGGLFALARKTKRTLYLCLIPLSFTLYFQQLTLALLVVLWFYLLGRVRGRRDVSRDSYILLAGVAAGCAVWIALAAIYVPADTVGKLKFALKGMLAYPPNFLRIYLETFPLLTLCFVGAAILIVRRSLDERRFGGPLLMLVWFLIPLALLGMHPLALVRLYERYVYFLNPLFLIVVAYGLSWAMGWLSDRSRPVARVLVGLALVLFLFVSGGAGLVRSVSWLAAGHGDSSAIFNRSLGRDEFSPDYRSPARFVCDNAKPTDSVIATDILGFFAYCTHADYQFTFSTKRDAEGWLGARTIPDTEALEAFLDEPRSETVWFVVAGLYELEYMDQRSLSQRWQAAVAAVEARAEKVFTGEDGRSRVYRLDPVTPRMALRQKNGS